MRLPLLGLLVLTISLFVLTGCQNDQIEEQRPLLIGEFGVFHAAPEESRIVWLSTVREEAEKRGFSWSVWDFVTDFAVYNLAQRTWREPLLRALIPES